MEVNLSLTEYEMALLNMIKRRPHEIPQGLQAAVIYALGVGSESGELLQATQRIFKNDGGQVTVERRNEIAAEAGDLLAYLTLLLNELDLSLVQVAFGNLEKLLQRVQESRLFDKEKGDRAPATKPSAEQAAAFVTTLEPTPKGEETMKLVTPQAREMRALKRRFQRQFGMGYLTSEGYQTLMATMGTLEKQIPAAIDPLAAARFMPPVEIREEEEAEEEEAA